MHTKKYSLLIVFCLFFHPSHGKDEDVVVKDAKKVFIEIFNNFEDVVILQKYSKQKKEYVERIYLKKGASTNEKIENIVIQPYIENLPSIPDLCLVAYNPIKQTNQMLFVTSGTKNNIVINSSERPFKFISLAELREHFKVQ